MGRASLCCKLHIREEFSWPFEGENIGLNCVSFASPSCCRYQRGHEDDCGQESAAGLKPGALKPLHLFPPLLTSSLPGSGEGDSLVETAFLPYPQLAGTASRRAWHSCCHQAGLVQPEITAVNASLCLQIPLLACLPHVLFGKRNIGAAAHLCSVRTEMGTSGLSPWDH